MSVKIVHAADFHLDSAFGALSAEQARQRRRESRELLTRLCNYVNQNGVDLVLLAGDLFDSDTTYRETLEALSEALGAMQARVFIAPGNHDPYSAKSPYATLSWPENVHIFTSKTVERVELPELQCAVYGALKLRKLHALDRLRREDVHILRPGKRRVGRLRAVRVVVAGGDEHSRLHCAQRLRERFQRLAIGRVAVEQVAREQHEIDAVLIHVIAKPRQQLAALAAALARLLSAQRAERAVQMEVRRVDNLHAHMFSPLMPAGRALSPCTHRPRRQSLRNTSQARRRSSRWRCSRCPPRGKPCRSV